jgi:hypothetical protein
MSDSNGVASAQADDFGNPDLPFALSRPQDGTTTYRDPRT